VGSTVDDIVDEARRITTAADDAGLPVRLIGGVAIRLHADQLPDELRRPYQDNDLVTTGKAGRPAVKLLAELGYAPNERFKAMNAGRRAVVYDVERERQIDIFIGEFQMCHKLDIAGRLDADRPTIPLAELLLTKLQIVELNARDEQDIYTLVYHHPIDDSDPNGIEAGFIGELCGADWGLWRTCKGTIERCLADAGNYGAAPAAEQTIRERLAQLWARIDAAPKSGKWKRRNRLGDRVRWYQEPEEE
jgi:hypothetical protein